MIIENTMRQPSEGRTVTFHSVMNLIIDVGFLGKVTADIGKVLYIFKFLSTNEDFSSRWELTRSRLIKGLSFVNVERQPQTFVCIMTGLEWIVSQPQCATIAQSSAYSSRFTAVTVVLVWRANEQDWRVFHPCHRPNRCLPQAEGGPQRETVWQLSTGRIGWEQWRSSAWLQLWLWKGPTQSHYTGWWPSCLQAEAWRC